jgi:mono/diheme cytochrome c family protein
MKTGDTIHFLADRPKAKNGWCPRFFALLLCCCAARPPAPSTPSVEPLAAEEGEIALGQSCLSCHSVELIEATRIGEAGWTAEVAKMRKWGALVDEEAAGPLAGWLARRYPVAEPGPAPALLTKQEVEEPLELRTPSGAAAAGAPLYAQSCAACHGAQALGSGGGPVLVEAPSLYRPATFADLVRSGSGRMPGFELAPAQISDLLAHLRTLR